MSKDNFEFHRRLPLQKITEDLPYRLAGIKKEKKIISDSSESSDEINTEFVSNDNIPHEQKNIKKEYTFRKKRKKFDNKIQRPKTSFLNRDRINITLYFNKHTNNIKQSSENNNNQTKTNFGKYNVESIDDMPKGEISYCNFDSSKSDGCKNIYPFLTEFDYESEENRRRREHLENIHVSGTVLVPSSCKDLQNPSELESNLREKNTMKLFSKKENKEEEEVCREIENWQTFLKNESYDPDEENSKSKSSDPIENDDDPSKLSNENPDQLENTDPALENSKEATRFKEMLKNARPKPITISSNLQEKVSNRVMLKKKVTAAVHNSKIASYSQPVLPITWQSAKKSLVVKRHENKLQDYLEIHKTNKLITHDEIESLGKTLKKVEKQNIKAKEKKNIPEWAQWTSQPILMTAPKKTKVIVRSKYMKENDFFT